MFLNVIVKTLLDPVRIKRQDVEVGVGVGVFTSLYEPLIHFAGELIITIVDVNRHAPIFPEPSYYVSVVEEQPIGTVLGTFLATDKETPISAIVISPPSDYFEVDNVTGKV